MQTITRNSAKCKKCGDEIESKSVHDFRSCGCGAIAVDGGHDYLRRVGNVEDFEDTSTVVEEPYVFPNKTVTKSSTSVVMKNSSCPGCGCLRTKSRRKGCSCVCHGE